MSGEFQVNVKSLSELDIGGRETCISSNFIELVNSFFIYSNFKQQLLKKPV